MAQTLKGLAPSPQSTQCDLRLQREGTPAIRLVATMQCLQDVKQVRGFGAMAARHTGPSSAPVARHAFRRVARADISRLKSSVAIAKQHREPNTGAVKAGNSQIELSICVKVCHRGAKAKVACCVAARRQFTNHYLAGLVQLFSFESSKCQSSLGRMEFEPHLH